MIQGGVEGGIAGKGQDAVQSLHEHESEQLRSGTRTDVFDSLKRNKKMRREKEREREKERSLRIEHYL
jgi:hypothetical protein